MGPIKPDDRPVKQNEKLKSWSTINKERKEKRRKWREENLKKKLSKKDEAKEKPRTEETAPVKTVSTLSIAIAGTILENTQSPLLRTSLIEQIARAASVYEVDEIVIFDDYSDEHNAKRDTFQDSYGTKTVRQSCVQFARILQYLECPHYLRKHFSFDSRKNSNFYETLSPINVPHNLDKNDKFIFREGVVLNKPLKEGGNSLVYVGLTKEVRVDKALRPGIRCTVKLGYQQETKKKLKGTLVAPCTPRNETGIYWGYTVRLANSLSKVFSECPYKGGYDLTLGTSDKGASVDKMECPSYKHLLIVFGGLHGLECALETDDALQVDDPKHLFHLYLNTVPEQGSKTVRTEEAVWISLSALRSKLNPEVRPEKCNLNWSQLENKTPASDDMDVN